MKNSAYDGCDDEYYGYTWGDPIWLKADEPLYLLADDVEEEEYEGDEADPNNCSVCRHVAIVVVEMGQYWVLHISGFAHVRNDEIGGVVEQITDQEATPDGCCPASADTKSRKDNSINAEHAIKHTKNCGGCCNFVSSVKVIFIIFGMQDIFNSLHLIV